MTRELKNPGTADATGDLQCRSCGHVGPIEAFPAAMSIYQDICCPVCGSTNNEHNSIYQKQLMENMRRADGQTQ